MIIASHNLMHGRRLSELLTYHQALRASVGLDVLCLQENGLDPDGSGLFHVERVAAELGPDYAWCSDPVFPGIATIYSTARFQCREHWLVPLPRLERLSGIERFYISGGKTKQKYALVAVLEEASGRSLTVACFHLDAAGGNPHRRAQVQALAEALRDRGLAQRFVVCGDTNAFSWKRRRHGEALGAVMQPLSALGGAYPDCGPTHFFARQREPLFTHRLCTLAGHLGLDHPLRYDIVCTDMPLEESGQVQTPGSDHDLVWARLAVDPPPGC